MKLFIRTLLLAVVQLACSPTFAYAQEPVTAMNSSEESKHQGFYTLTNKDVQLVQALKAVRSKLSANSDAYFTFGFDDLIFIKTIVPPQPGLIDVDSQKEMVAVRTGVTPQVITLPNETLFAHCMQKMRKNPGRYPLADRVRLAITLATGDDNYSNFDNRKPDPSWVESKGVLTLRYYRMALSYSSAPPWMEVCTLTADSQNKPNLSCQKIADSPFK